MTTAHPSQDADPIGLADVRRLPPPSVTAATRRRARTRDAAVALLYCLVTVWWTWPLPALWRDHLLYPSDGELGVLARADAYLIVWILSWVAHAVHDPLHLFDGNIFHPAPLSLAFSEHLIGYLPLFGPTYWLSRNPILALNVAAVATYPLSAFAAYLLVRRFCGAAPAVLGGLLFAFSGARYFAPPHYHMLGMQWFPLIVLSLDAWLGTGRTVVAVAFALLVALQLLTSVYYMYAVALLLVPVVPLIAFRHRARLARVRRRDIVLVAAFEAAVVASVMWPYLRVRSWGLVPSYGDAGTALGLVPWVARIHVRHYLLHDGVGPVGYALGAVGLVAGGRIAGGWPRLLGGVLAVYGVLISLGPRVWTSWGEIPSPYALLDFVPGFATIRMPARFVVLAQLGFALLAAVGAAVLLRRCSGRTRRLATLLLAALVLLPARHLPALESHREIVRDTAPPALTWLAENGRGRAVLELPPARDAAQNAQRAYLSTFHWQPIVDGYSAYPPSHPKEIHWIAHRLPAADALHELLDLVDVGWLLVHRDRLPALARPLWNGPLPDGLVLRAEWGDVALYEVTYVPVSTRRTRLLSTTETLDGAPIAPVTGPCPGSIDVRDWPTGPLVSATEVRATVIIDNRSDSVWPARGFLPHGLVHVEGLIRDLHGQVVGEPLVVPLHEDVRPGCPLKATMRMLAPAEGTYRLELRLVQDGVQSLAQCGTASRELSFTTHSARAPTG